MRQDSRSEQIAAPKRPGLAMKKGTEERTHAAKPTRVASIHSAETRRVRTWSETAAFPEEKSSSFNSRPTLIVPTISEPTRQERPATKAAIAAEARSASPTSVGTTTAVAVDVTLLAIGSGGLSSEEEELLLSAGHVTSVSIEVDSGSAQRDPIATATAWPVRDRAEPESAFPLTKRVAPIPNAQEGISPSAEDAPARSALRSSLTKLVFLLVFGGTLALLAFEVHAKLGRWPDFRTSLVRFR